MKTLKKALLATTITSAFVIFALGSMNSIVVDKNAFLKNDLNIKFAKRLDDMNGEVTVGRTAASLPKFDFSKTLSVKETVETPKKKINKIVKAKKVEIKKFEETKPVPVVANTDSLELTGGFYQKKSLKDAVFSGSVQVVNGVIEGLNATLPDGKSLNIKIVNEEMVGHVFQYEDSETREIKSGLFYAVNKAKGEYMLNLTDDSNFAGIRLEFKDPNLADIAPSTSNWAMNDQNIEDKSEYAQNETEENEEESEKEENNEQDELEENYAQNETEETYAFAF